MALEFDASTTYIDCGTDPSIDNLSSRTIAGWIHLNGWGENNEGIIMAQARYSAAGWQFDVRGTGNQNTLGFYQNHSIGTGEWRAAIDGLVLSAKTHVAVVYDNSNNANNPTFYINGVVSAFGEIQTPNGLATDVSAFSVIVGDGNPGTTRAFDGKMEDFRMFNGGKTAEEIALLASGYCGAIGGEVLWLKMREANGISGWPDGQTLAQGVNLLPDASGNGNDGDPYGSPIIRPLLISCRGRSKRHFMGMM